MKPIPNPTKLMQECTEQKEREALDRLRADLELEAGQRVDQTINLRRFWCMSPTAHPDDRLAGFDK